VLFGLLYIICEMYIDDCIVYANGNAQFLENLSFNVFKAKKCKFGFSSIEYVGKVRKKRSNPFLTFPVPKTTLVFEHYSD
jgi:hypothetical protein